jgi:hypothetical protein
MATTDSRYATQWQTAAESPRGCFRKMRQTLRGLYLDLVSAVPIGFPDRFLKCLCCHYVFDNQLKEFESLIIELKEHGTFVRSEDCIEMARGRRRVDQCYLHLTFDDGLRNVVKNAFPILARHEVPATFFVPSGMVGASFDTAERFCRRERYRSTSEFATWEDLKALDPALVTIGSHTKNHIRLSDISVDPVRLRDELSGSKSEIEDRLGRECTLFAWPRGQRPDIDVVSLTMAKQVGYQAAFGAFGGSVVSRTPDTFVIPRQHFEVQWPRRHVMYLIRRP